MSLTVAGRVHAEYDLDEAIIVFNFQFSSGTSVAETPQFATYRTLNSTFTILTDRDFVRECPSISPDGKHIAFRGYMPGGRKEIFTIAIDGTNQIQLTDNFQDDGNVTWSPDGRYLLFDRTFEPYDTDIIIKDLQTGIEQNLSQDPLTDDTRPSFSRTGSQIVFSSNRTGTGILTLFKMNSDGSAQQQIPLPADLSAGDARWSPVDDRIIFKGGRNYDTALYVVNSDGTGLRQIMADSAVPDFASFVWAPDGSGVFLNRSDSIYWLSADATVGEPTYLFRMRGDSGIGLSAPCFDIHFPPTSTLSASATLARPTAGQNFRAILSQSGTVTLNMLIAANTGGVLPIPNVYDGVYALWVKHAQHLAASVPVTVSAPTIPVAVGALRAGDANNNNHVNITDYSILAASYGKSSGTAGYDARADFNGDNTVTVSDYSLLAANFGLVGAPNPSPEGMMSAALSDVTPPELAHAAITLEGAPRGGARIGRTFTLTVRAGNNDSAGAGVVASQIDGLDVHLRFDPALLQVVAVTPGTTLDQVIVATFDNAAGTIEVAAGELGGSVTGRFSAFTVTFRAIAAGTTTIDADAPTALAYQGATVSPALASASVTAR